MSERVAIVTDSTAYLPDEVVQEHGIRVVPLQVVIGGTSYDEGSGVSSATVADALRAWTPVSTSRPGPFAFLSVFEQAAEEGYTSAVSLHLSSDMSGTYESAVMGARDAPIPVRVVDSRSLGMGLGFAVVTAAELAAGGSSLDEVTAAAEKRVAAASAVFYVDTLEYLRRGGRIGAAAAFLGSALAIKPLLHLVDGHIEPLEKVRTAARAIARLEELAVERDGEGPFDVAVHHLAKAAPPARQ
jgi:DegV family protein with EDD domain